MLELLLAAYLQFSTILGGVAPANNGLVEPTTTTTTTTTSLDTGGTGWGEGQITATSTSSLETGGTGWGEGQ